MPLESWVTTTDVEGRYQTPYTALCKGVISHWGSIWGSSGFCRPHTQKALRVKPKDPQIEPHAGIKMVQGLGISLLYICGHYPLTLDWGIR